MNRLIPLRSRKEGVSVLADTKTAIVLLTLLVLTFAAFIISACLGSKSTSPVDVLLTIFGAGDADNRLVIGTLRLPRLALAMLAGAALSVAGSVLQGIVRNPLASPDLLGITGGASIAAVAFITYLGDWSIRWMPLAALAGAGLVSAVVYLLAWRNGVTPTRLVLIGIGIAAGTSSMTMMMITLSPITAASRAYIWLTGSVYGATWDQVLTLLPWTAIFLPIALVLARHLNLQGLGDDIAKGAGASVQRYRLLLLFVCVALAGSAVAMVGAVGFIGLIAPHIARKLVGPFYGGLIPASALIGSLLMLLADTVGRTAFHPLDVPAGVFTAAIGAPFFIFLLYRSRHH